jgi:predicted DNA-binding transcriptional regulator YafY
MSTNKHASIRYHALDKCFSNFQKKYFIEDLIKACNDAIYKEYGNHEGVHRRQIFNDIKFIENNEDYNAEIEKIYDGKRKYYRYKDENFSILKKQISDNEIKQLKKALNLLSKLKGFSNLEWIDEIITRIDSDINQSTNDVKIIEFQQNDYPDGLNYLEEIYNAIINQQALKVTYKGYRSEEKQAFDFHPYFLKQYNTRWFLFGFNDKHQKISNLALDRIKDIKESKVKYKSNVDSDLLEHFFDIVGVTLKPDENVEHIVLEIHKDLLPYIVSKPLHGSQKVAKKIEEWTKLSLDVKVNYELESLLLSHGEGIRVLEPVAFRNKLYERVIKMKNNFTLNQ